MKPFSAGKTFVPFRPGQPPGLPSVLAMPVPDEAAVQTGKETFAIDRDFRFVLPESVTKYGSFSDPNSIILGEGGLEVYRFVQRFVDPYAKGCLLRTSDLSPLSTLNGATYPHVISLRRINDMRRLNKFFESVNARLSPGGIFIGKVELYQKRKAKIMAAYPKGINKVMYGLYYIANRVFPKLPWTKQIYFLTTRGNNRVLSQAETYGRLFSCGFEITGELFVNGFCYFACRKVKEPAFDTHPTYGAIIRLRRIGRGGQPFFVYKLRTMYAYSEYLQPYVHRKADLDRGGKFRDDFRVTTLGRFLRKFWIDELPMLVNVLVKRNMKIVGVRPLSEHYFNLYTKDLQQKRTRHKPGLVPPYYAQWPTPETLDEIQQNEREYLDAYETAPLRTDLRYFFRAACNILFRKARSK